MKGAIITLSLVALLVVACGDAGTDGGPTDSSKAAVAAGIANEIAANPEQMDAILEKHGMTAKEFEDLLSEIAEDEDLTNEFEAAVTR